MRLQMCLPPAMSHSSLVHEGPLRTVTSPALPLSRQVKIKSTNGKRRRPFGGLFGSGQKIREDQLATDDIILLIAYILLLKTTTTSSIFQKTNVILLLNLHERKTHWKREPFFSCCTRPTRCCHTAPPEPPYKSAMLRGKTETGP